MSARDPAVVDVVQVLLELRDEVRTLRDEVQALRGRRHAPEAFDPAALDLVAAVAAAAGKASFSTQELIAHAEIDHTLRAAIDASVGGQNARRLGRLLRKLEGYQVGGHRLHLSGTDRDGHIWRCDAA